MCTAEVKALERRLDWVVDSERAQAHGEPIITGTY